MQDVQVDAERRREKKMSGMAVFWGEGESGLHFFVSFSCLKNHKNHLPMLPRQRCKLQRARSLSQSFQSVVRDQRARVPHGMAEGGQIFKKENEKT